MDEASQITTQVKSVELKNFRALHQRMDDDYVRWQAKGVPLRESLGSLSPAGTAKTEIKVVSNAPRTFCDNVQSILSSSERQIIVRMAQTQTGEDLREAIAKLERLLEYAFYKADERLIKLLLPTLKESLVWYSIVRGWVAGRFLTYKEDGEVVFNFLPYDPRWLVYQKGGKGLLWTAYTTYRSAPELEDEYGKEVRKTPWTKERDLYPVIDYWLYEGKNKISNAVICENEFIKEPEEYLIKSMPVLIAPVATRPPIQGALSNEMEGYGESILAPNRRVDDLLNTLATMWASHANLLYKQPLLNYLDSEGTRLNSTILYAEGIYNLPLGHQKIEPSPLKEISPTLVNLFQVLDSWRVRGSMPDIDIRQPPQSGTLQNLVQEAANRVFNPQLRNLNSFYGNICRLIEEQLAEGGVGGEKIKKVNVKGILKSEYYEMDIRPLDIKKPHTIKVEFIARAPWMRFETYQIADMAKRQGLPDAFIQEYILKLPSPKEISDMSAIEMAEHSPKLAMVRAIRALMKAGRIDEAEQLMRDLYQMEMSEQMAAQGAGIGQPPPSEAAPRGAPPVVGGEAGEGVEALGPPEEMPPTIGGPPAVERI